MTWWVWTLLATGLVVSGASGVLVGRMMGRVSVTLKDFIGLAVLGAFIAALFILFWKAIPPSNEQLIVYMLGQLSGFAAGVVSSHYVHKAGEDALQRQRNETNKAQAESVKELAATVQSALDATPGKSDEAAAARDVADAASDEARRIAEEGAER